MKFLEHSKFMSDLVKGRVLKKRIPLTVSLTITNRCNYKCIYCYGEYFNRKDDDVPTEVWIDLVNELADMGTRMIHLGGGEPLLNKDFDKIIDAVKDRHMICRINTNGKLIPKYIDRLKRIDSVCVLACRQRYGSI